MSTRDGHPTTTKRPEGPAMKLRKHGDTSGEADDRASDGASNGASNRASDRASNDVTTTRTGEDLDNDLSAPSPDEGPDSPVQLKGRGVFAALRRTVKQFSEDNVTDWAAALTYYGVL